MSERDHAPKGVKIGLEIHCQLTALRTKLFCPCSSDYRDKEPNELVCPVCFGLPGTLPVLNEKAVEYALRIAIALGCKVAERDDVLQEELLLSGPAEELPDQPVRQGRRSPHRVGGSVQLGKKRVSVRRIQLEEDPGS